jgi:hypothetical protein
MVRILPALSGLLLQQRLQQRLLQRLWQLRLR